MKGGETMDTAKERGKALAQYRKEHFKRIPLDVKPALYEQVKAAADAEGLPVNVWIRRAIGVYLMKKRWLPHTKDLKTGSFLFTFWQLT